MYEHSHGCSHSKQTHKPLIWATLFVLLFGVIEAVAGVMAHSLTLLGDAGHMFADSLGLLLAAFAAWISTKPASAKHSYGLGRSEVIAAWISSSILLILATFLIIEAIERLQHPQPIHSIPVIIVAVIGLIVNLITFKILHSSHQTTNIKAAALHVLGDLLSSFSVLISGVIIYFTHWTYIDPILSILISILIMIAGIRLLKETLRVLMEGVPIHLNKDDVKTSMKKVEHVTDVHDLHIWTLSSDMIALTAHVVLDNLKPWHDVLETIRNVLISDYKINHITLQPELIDTKNKRNKCAPCDDKSK